MFVVGETPVALFKLQGDFFALDNRCPHAGASLVHGTVEEGVVRCRIHHWGFCIREGRYVDEDRPEFDARTIPVRVVGDQVQVAIDGGDRTTLGSNR